MPPVEVVDVIGERGAARTADAHPPAQQPLENALLVGQYYREDFAELLALVRETHGKLLAHIDGIAAEALWEDRDVRARGWKVTVGRLLEAERRDEEAHHASSRRG